MRGFSAQHLYKVIVIKFGNGRRRRVEFEKYTPNAFKREVVKLSNSEEMEHELFSVIVAY